MTTGREEAKRILRARVRAALGRVDAAALGAASSAICRRLAGLDAWRGAGSVMLYLAKPGEVDVSALGERGLAAGVRVAAPRVDWDARAIEPWVVRGWPPRVEVRRHGVPEPAEGAPAPPSMIEAVLVPGLAFDASGRRLGRGGGYYDRFLARVRASARLIGVCLEVQVVDRVPVDTHDVAVDAVVTEGRSIITNARAD